MGNEIVHVFIPHLIADFVNFQVRPGQQHMAQDRVGLRLPKQGKKLAGAGQRGRNRPESPVLWQPAASASGWKTVRFTPDFDSSVMFWE